MCVRVYLYLYVCVCVCVCVFIHVMMHQALTVDVVLNRSVGVDGHGPVDPSTVDPHRRSHEDTLQHMREGEYEGGIVNNVNTVMALLADLVWWFC